MSGIFKTMIMLANINDRYVKRSDIFFKLLSIGTYDFFRSNDNAYNYMYFTHYR